MTSWSPATAAAYIAAHRLENAFYSRYPNAYGATHAADWMAIWLDSNVAPPDGPDNPADQVDTAAAVAEERTISTNPNYTMPFQPVITATPTNFPAANSPATVHQTTAPVPTAAQKKNAGSGKLPLLIGAGILGWLIFGRS